MKYFSKLAVVLPVIMVVLGLSGCANPAAPSVYTVTIAQGIQNGSITADPVSGIAGTEVTLTVSPAGGYQLKSGSLKYNDGADHDIAGTSFLLPARNVIVSGEFVSTNANLNGLMVSTGALVPDFSAAWGNYTVTVPNNITSITVMASKSDPNAVISYAPSQTVTDLPSGTPVTVIVTVKAENAAEKIYGITVIRSKNNNVNLSSLAVTPGALSPNFSTNGLNYAVTVPNNITSVTVTAAPADPTAVVRYAPSQTVTNLSAGTPVLVTVTVTAENEAEKEYTVMVTRLKSDNANLDSLMPSAGTLSPAFSAAWGNYTVTVPNDITTVTVMAASAAPNAVISYVPSQTVTDIPTGTPVTVMVTVKAENEAEKVYTVVITRLKNNNANLQSLTVDTGTLSPNFSADQSNYAVTVPNDITSVTVMAVSAAPTAVVRYAPSQTAANLPVGIPVTVLVTVKAENETEKVYTVTITRAKKNEKEITAFKIGSSDGVINEAAKTIAVIVPYGTSVNALTPVVSITGASVSPLSGTEQDFTSPVDYTVTAEDGTEAIYKVTVTRAQNSEKAITAFKIGTNDGVINETDKTITVIVPYGTNVTSLTPVVSISAEASVAPLSGTAQSFVAPKEYTVTAENGTPQKYTVTVIVKGQAGITIAGPLDENVLVTGFTGTKPVLSRSGKDSKPKNLTITVDDTNYTLVEWYINGVKKNTNPANSITIRSAEYPIREHSITVVVYRGTVPYSKLFTFEVQE
ncbi:hypothetical protein AGMMS49991_11130 [Spirochaetia bacterium]|nr:hypothetical protein AGMMS49991_11130 [Spirochaetia bacterium]